MFYDGVCLMGPHGQLIRVLVSECDDLRCQEYDVMESRDVIDDVTNPCAVGTFL